MLEPRDGFFGNCIDDKYVLFKQNKLFADSFPLMKEIRRQGKLCDVTLKVFHIHFL